MMPVALADYSARLRKLELESQSNMDGLEAHESICAERYRNIHEGMEAIREDSKQTNRYLIGIGMLLITGMAGVLVNLVFFK